MVSEEVRNTRRSVQGVVTSDKNDKTIVVLIETYKKHPKYGKRVKYRKKYYAHDEHNEAHVGDTVTIMETRPLSATKRWRLVSIDKKAALTVKQAEAQLKAEALEAEVDVKPTEPEETPASEETPVEKTPVVEETPVEEETTEEVPDVIDVTGVDPEIVEPEHSSVMDEVKENIKQYQKEDKEEK